MKLILKTLQAILTLYFLTVTLGFTAGFLYGVLKWATQLGYSLIAGAI